jgi:replicative DNA helicase
MAVFNKLNQFGVGFQVKVISSLLTDKNLLINIRDSIEPEYFDDNSHSWIVETIIKYFDKYHTIPSIDVVHVEVKKIENEILKLSVIEQLKEAYKASDDDLRYIKEEFAEFCMNQQIKKALLTSVDLLNAGDYDSIKRLMANALKAKEDKNVGHVYEKDIESRYREDDRRPIPFPWKALNDITQGGYGKGELILIFGNPKGGKSWVAICMAAFAVALGYNIVYYTLELAEGYVGKRFDAVFTQIAVELLKDNRDKVEEKVAQLRGKLRIKEFAAKRASLDHVEAHLNQLELQEDFKADGIFIDYLDLMKNRISVRKEIRDDLDDVYTDARGLARERKVPIISPSQVNRAGANDDIIEADKIAGSYGKIMIGDFVMSLSRKKKDKVAGTGRFHIMGNRLGPDGITFFAKIDTSKGYIDIDETPIDMDDEDEVEGGNKYSTKKPSDGGFDDVDKKMLRGKLKLLAKTE